MATLMITPDFVRTMAAYNAEMNRRLYAAADRLSDAERKKPRGAFWGSIEATFAHLLWGDSTWMSRFDGWEKPKWTLKRSDEWACDFAALARVRAEADARISNWAERVTPEWLDGDLSWFSGAAGFEVKKPVGLLVTHFFNHQTHHCGQIHAMLTAAGEATGATDLFLVV